MTAWFKGNSSIVWSWAGLIAAALIIFVATRGTAYGQLAVGLLISAIALLVAMAIFELIWQGAVGRFSAGGDEQAAKSTPKHRQRGQ